MSVVSQERRSSQGPATISVLSWQAATQRVERHEPPQTDYIRLARLGDLALGLVALIGGFLAANLGRMPAGLQEFLELRVTVRNLVLLGVFTVAWRFLCERAGLYDQGRVRRLPAEMVRVVLVCAVGTVGAMVFPFISRTGAFDLKAVLYFGVVAAAGLILLRLGLRAVAGTALPSLREVLIVGTGPRAWQAYVQLQEDAHIQHRVLGFIDTDDKLARDEIRCAWAGALVDLESILMRRSVDEVLIALPIRSKYSEIQWTIETCWRFGVRCKYLADVFDHGRGRAKLEQANRLSTVAVAVAPDDGRLMVKRAADIIGSLVGLMVVAPILVVSALAIKVTSPGPVVFTQDRHGLHKRRFRMYKLRTMVTNAEDLQVDLEHQNEATGPVFKMRNDPRVTRVGKFLRRTAIDELPQLWNVLRGEMSLIGPRPLPVRDVERFTEGALMRRFSVRPGLSGLWQVKRKDVLVFDDWVRLDMRYIDEWSLLLDLKILILTVPAVLRGNGAT